MTKTFYISGLLILLPILAMAQIETKVSPWDVRIAAALGNSSFSTHSDYNITSKANKFNSIGLTANYNITSAFGFAFGAEYKTSNSSLTLSNYNASYQGIDNWEGDTEPRNYVFSIDGNNTDIAEDVSISYIGIPISLFYNIPLSQKINLVSRLGFTPLAMPIKSNHKLTTSDLTTQLYFNEWDLLLHDIPAHGLYTNRTNWHPDNPLDVNYMYSIFGEIGFDFPFLVVFRTNLSFYYANTFGNNLSDNANALIHWREDYKGILAISKNARLVETGIKLSIGLNKNTENTTIIEHNCAGCTWLRTERKKRRNK